MKESNDMIWIEHEFDATEAKELAAEYMKEYNNEPIPPEIKKPTRAEKRRLDRGMGICFHPQCQKLRKLNEMGLCRACDPATIRKGSERDVTV